MRLLTDPLLRHRVAHLRRQVPPGDRRAGGARRGADLTPAPRPPRPRLAAAARPRDAADRARAAPAAWLRGRGFTDVSELAAGESPTASAGSRVTGGEARHDGRRAPRGPRRRDVGYPRARPAHGLLRRRHRAVRGHGGPGAGLDVALLPVAGWGRRSAPGTWIRARRRARPRFCAADRDPDALGDLSPIGLGRRRRAAARPAAPIRQQVAELAPASKCASSRPARRRRSEKQTGASTRDYMQRGVLRPRRRLPPYKGSAWAAGFVQYPVVHCARNQEHRFRNEPAADEEPSRAARGPHLNDRVSWPSRAGPPRTRGRDGGG